MAVGSGLVKLLAASCPFWCECPGEVTGMATRERVINRRVWTYARDYYFWTPQYNSYKTHEVWYKPGDKFFYFYNP